MTYQTFTPISGTQRLNPSALGVPPGTAVEPQVAELLRDVALQLRLPEAGVVTPWATRKGDLDWQEIEKPDTNIATFQLTDAQILEASKLLFGQSLPFVTVMSGDLQSISELKRILEDSNYELFETQGVYRQDDSDPMPRILYLHWLRVKDLADQPARFVKPMEQVAKEMRGLLLFSQQVPVEGTTLRGHPDISFEDSLDIQDPKPIVLPEQPDSPAPPPPEDAQQPEPPQASVAKGSLVGPVLFGFGVLAATIVVGKAVRKK